MLLRCHSRIPPGPSHRRQLPVRRHRTSTRGHYRRCDPRSVFRSRIYDEAASPPAHDALRSARPRVLCTKDLGYLRAVSCFRSVQHFTVHKRDRGIDDCDEQPTSWTAHLGLWDLLVGVCMYYDLALHRGRSESFVEVGSDTGYLVTSTPFAYKDDYVEILDFLRLPGGIYQCSGATR